MIIYISGQITGLPIDEAKAIFKDAQQRLEKTGAKVINPFDIVDYSEHLTWNDYMIENIKILFDCDIIVMLKGWEKSKGARIGHSIAVIMEKIII